MKKLVTIAALIALAPFAQTRVQAQPAVSITSLNASPAVIPCGSSATISWSTSDGTSATMYGGIFGGTPVALSGSSSTGVLYSNTTYVLYVYGTSSAASAMVMVSVIPDNDTTSTAHFGYETHPNYYSYPFASADIALILGGYVVIHDNGVVQVSSIDTIFHTDTTYTVLDCSGMVVSNFYHMHLENVPGISSRDTMHNYWYDTVWTSVGVVNLAEKEAAINIYPNPASSSEKVTAMVPGSGTLVLTDVSGRTVRTMSFEDTCTIEHDDLPAGTYVATFILTEGIVSRKIIFR